MNTPKISAVVIARNEEENLSDCLKSLDWADELIYVDNDSIDDSLRIAKKFGASIYKFKRGNFASRKNYAFGKVKTEWFLSVDADERVTPELRNEISELISNFQFPISNDGAYAIPRKNIILGKELKHGGWWPDYVIRLYRTKDFISVENELHEQPKFKGELGYLKSALIHIKHDNLSDMVEKTNEWSEVEARLMLEAHHPPMNIFRFFSAGAREFFLRMVKNKGFLDGTEGVIYSLYQVYSRLISYAKLWEMQLIQGTIGTKSTKSTK